MMCFAANIEDISQGREPEFTKLDSHALMGKREDFAKKFILGSIVEEKNAEELRKIVENHKSEEILLANYLGIEAVKIEVHSYLESYRYSVKIDGLSEEQCEQIRLKLSNISSEISIEGKYIKTKPNIKLDSMPSDFLMNACPI